MFLLVFYMYLTVSACNYTCIPILSVIEGWTYFFFESIKHAELFEFFKKMYVLHKLSSTSILFIYFFLLQSIFFINIMCWGKYQNG